MKTYYSYSILVLLILSGCMVGPDYIPPTVCISDEWNGEPRCDDGSTCGTISLANPIIDWWNLFEDSLLSKYIKMGALHNKDILEAEASILQARAIRQIAASRLFPQIQGDLNATKTYFSKNGPLFTLNNPSGVAPTPSPFQVQIPQMQNLYNALIDASWEIDLFGKTLRSVEATQAYYESEIEQRNNVLITTLAEIAINYVEIRSLQKRLKLIEENISFLEQNAEITSSSLKVGYSNRLDYENIEAILAASRANLPIIVAQIYRGIYALSVLTGNLPETLTCELVEPKPLPKLPCPIEIGLRSDILKRRPDVRKAEREFAAANALIGFAVASFYPTFTITSNYGFQSLQLKNLFQSASQTYSIGGALSLPIFEGGRLVGTLRLSEALAAHAAYNYQKVILNALQEAEGALVSYSEDLIAARKLQGSVESNRKLVYLTGERFKKGLATLTDFLTSERQLISVEQNYLDIETASLTDLITLYKALGGGWEPVDIITEPLPLCIEP